MDKQKQIEKVKGRLRKNDVFSLFSGRADREVLMSFCNLLADKIDEIIEVINKQEKENG